MKIANRLLILLVATLLFASCRPRQSVSSELRDVSVKDLPQYKRFALHLENLEKILIAKSDVGEAIGHIEAEDARSHIFRLEALTRLYKRRNGVDLEKFEEKVTGFEDVLGKYSDTTKILKFARDASAPIQLVEYLEKKNRESKLTFGEFLKREGWFGSDADAITKLRKIAADQDWGRPDNDREFLNEKIAGYVDEIRDRNYPLEDLEEGIHRLRRHLRWVVVDVQGVAGMIVPEKESCPVPVYSLIQSSDIGAAKYTDIPRREWEPRPCLVSKCLFLAMTLHNKRIGEAKDIAEAVEMISRALEESGMARTSVQAHSQANDIVSHHPAFIDAVSRAQAEHKQIVQTKLLEHVSAEFRSCR